MIEKADNETWRNSRKADEVRDGCIPLVFRLGDEIDEQRPLAAPTRAGYGKLMLQVLRGVEVDKYVSSKTRIRISALPRTNISRYSRRNVVQQWLLQFPPLPLKLKLKILYPSHKSP